MTWSRRRLLLAVSATLVAVDLAQKASAPVYGHPRGPFFDIVAACLTLGVVAFVPRVPSRAMAVVGGIAAAGAAGNLISALAWRGGVPNPIVAGELAFNIADVCAVMGSAGLVAGALLVAVRNPSLLRQPI